MGGPQHNRRPRKPRLLALRGGKANRRVRIDDNSGVLEQAVHGRRRVLAGDALSREPLADGGR